MPLTRVLLAAAFATATFAAQAAEPGVFGFQVSVDGEGFFLNPTIKEVRIDKVLAKSPAEAAGIAAGDVVVEIEGHAVTGTKADVLKPYLKREVGQATRFVIRKPDGSVKTLTLTPVAKAAVGPG